MTIAPAVLDINDLVIEVPTESGHRTAVDGVSLSVARSGSLGIVGESGSGKSLTVLSTLGLLPEGARIASGSIRVNGTEITDFDDRQMRAIRGKTAAMVFQDPMSALNPLRAVGAQVAAAIRAHQPAMTRRAARLRAVELLELVGVKDAANRAQTRPHEWSGGMRQRAVIAMAMAHEPLLLIADEPTTALDVTIQAQVMSVLRDVRERTGSALVLITHDLGLVAENTDDLVVMYRGEIVERGKTAEVLASPKHDYTERLLAARPEAHEADRPEAGERSQAPALVATDITVTYPGAVRGAAAVDGISLTVERGETVALVGESGCGKSSFARAVLGITAASSGTVELAGSQVPSQLEKRSALDRAKVQIVFQDPYSALDPRLSIAEIVAEPLRIRRSYRPDRVTQLLADVGLDESFAKRRPAQLSGGQRQRVGIARALALQPALLVLDEPVSALDVSIQAQVLDLLDSLQREHGLGYLFISHDLGVVRNIADRVVVMQNGRIVEQGRTADIFANPRHDFTRTLLESVPTLA